jgi:hypothetical protein
VKKSKTRSMLILLGLSLFVVGQSLAWFQVNGQFISEWCKDHPILVSFLGVPIGLAFMYGTGYLYEGFDGQTWPARLLTFAVGIVVFIACTNWFLGEPVTWKTGISLLLTFIIILIQIL